MGRSWQGDSYQAEGAECDNDQGVTNSLFQPHSSVLSSFLSGPHPTPTPPPDFRVWLSLEGSSSLFGVFLF